MRPRKSFHRSTYLIRKFIAIFLSFSLILSESASYAQNFQGINVGIGKVNQEVSSGIKQSQKDLFSFPAEFGSIEETHQGITEKTIVYIQDAHDSLEAQENIANIIANLVEQYEVDTVFEEGYEGPVPTDAYFDFIKDPELKEQVAYFLMDKLRIRGAEYAHIKREKEFKLTGADSMKLHLENIEAYKQASRKQKVIQRDLDALEKKIRGLAHKYFPTELKQWMKLKQRLDDEKLELFDYLQRVWALHPVEDFTDKFPNLKLLLSLKDNPDSQDEASAKNIELKKIFSEIRGLEKDFASQYLMNNRDMQIFEYYQSLKVLVRLNQIRVTSEEYGAIESNLKNLKTDQLAEFIAKHTRKSVVLSKRWEQNLRDAIRFYELANARDHAVEKTFEGFDGDSAILIFGGFHKENIKEILKRKGYSYLIVTPRINSISKKHQAYYKRLMSVGYHESELMDQARKASAQAGVFHKVSRNRFPPYTLNFLRRESSPLADPLELFVRSEIRSGSGDRYEVSFGSREGFAIYESRIREVVKTAYGRDVQTIVQDRVHPNVFNLDSWGVLKFPEYRAEAGLAKRELEVMEQAGREGANVPTVIRTRGGDTVYQAEDVPLMVIFDMLEGSSFVRGKPTSNESLIAHARQMGLAHRALDGYRPMEGRSFTDLEWKQFPIISPMNVEIGLGKLEGFARQIDTAEPPTKFEQAFQSHRVEIDRSIDSVRRKLSYRRIKELHDEGRVRAHYVHGDEHYGNEIWLDARTPYNIDFEMTHYDLRLYDLLHDFVMHWEWRIGDEEDQRQWFQDRAVLFLSTYESASGLPLTSDEFNILPAMIERWHLEVMLWMLQVRNVYPDQDRLTANFEQIFRHLELIQDVDWEAIKRGVRRARVIDSTAAASTRALIDRIDLDLLHEGETVDILFDVIAVNQASGDELVKVNQDLMADVARERATGTLFRATDSQGRMVGYAWVTLGGTDFEHAEFYLLGIRNDWHEAGLGRRLADQVLNYLREIKVAQVGATVRPDNNRIIRLVDTIVQDEGLSFESLWLETPDGNLVASVGETVFELLERARIQHDVIDPTVYSIMLEIGLENVVQTAEDDRTQRSELRQPSEHVGGDLTRRFRDRKQNRFFMSGTSKEPGGLPPLRKLLHQLISERTAEEFSNEDLYLWMSVQSFLDFGPNRTADFTRWLKLQGSRQAVALGPFLGADFASGSDDYQSQSHNDVWLSGQSERFRVIISDIINGDLVIAPPEYLHSRDNVDYAFLATQIDRLLTTDGFAILDITAFDDDEISELISARDLHVYSADHYRIVTKQPYETVIDQVIDELRQAKAFNAQPAVEIAAKDKRSEVRVYEGDRWKSVRRRVHGWSRGILFNREFRGAKVVSPRWIVADDFTGAFSIADHITKVYGTRAMVIDNVDVLADGGTPKDLTFVIDTKAGSFSPEEALARNERVANLLIERKVMPDIKIDYSIRNVRHALSGLYDAFDFDYMFFVPAMETLGTKTEQGIHFVFEEGGWEPVHQSSKAGESRRRITESYIPKFLEQELGISTERVLRIPLQTIEQGPTAIQAYIRVRNPAKGTVIVPDVVTTNHLEHIAEAVREIEDGVFSESKKILRVGASDFLRALMQRSPNVEALPKQGAPVAIVGSVNPITTAQVRFAEEMYGNQLVRLQLDNQKVLEGAAQASEEIERLRGLLKPVLESGKPVVLTTTRERLELHAEQAVTISRTLTQVIQDPEILSMITALFVSGGETIGMLTETLKSTGVEAKGQFTQRVPMGVLFVGLEGANLSGGIPIVTKQGGNALNPEVVYQFFRTALPKDTGEEKWLNSHLSDSRGNAMVFFTENYRHPGIPVFRKNPNGDGYQVRKVRGVRMESYVGLLSSLSDDEFMQQLVKWTIEIGRSTIELLTSGAGIFHGEIEPGSIVIDELTEWPVLTGFQTGVSWSDVKGVQQIIDLLTIKRIMTRPPPDMPVQPMNAGMFTVDGGDLIEAVQALVDEDLKQIQGRAKDGMLLGDYVHELTEYYTRKWPNAPLPRQRSEVRTYEDVPSRQTRIGTAHRRNTWFDDYLFRGIESGDYGNINTVVDFGMGQDWQTNPHRPWSSTFFGLLDRFYELIPVGLRMFGFDHHPYVAEHNEEELATRSYPNAEVSIITGGFDSPIEVIGQEADMLFVRNVLGYYSLEERDQSLALLSATLREGAHLIEGDLGVFKIWRKVNSELTPLSIHFSPSLNITNKQIREIISLDFPTIRFSRIQIDRSGKGVHVTLRPAERTDGWWAGISNLPELGIWTYLHPYFRRSGRSEVRHVAVPQVTNQTFSYQDVQRQWGEIGNESEYVYDTLIVGGGAAGAGALRDLATRGNVSALLVEKGEFAGATSSKSGKAIHPGLWYLRMAWHHLLVAFRIRKEPDSKLTFGQRLYAFWDNLELVWYGTRERKIFVRTTEGIVEPLPHTAFIYSDSPDQRWQAFLGIRMYEWFSRLWAGKFGDTKFYKTAEAVTEELPFVDQENLVGAVKYWDAKANNDKTLVVKTIRDAYYRSSEENPIRALSRTELKSYEWVAGVNGDPGYFEVTLVNEANEEVVVRARTLTNAAGAWIDDVHKRTADGDSRSDLVKWGGGSQIEATNAFINEQLNAGNQEALQTALAPLLKTRRYFFRWYKNNGIWFLRMGSTDRKDKTPEDMRPKEDEIQELVHAYNSMVADPRWQISRSDIYHTDSGIRPLVKPEGEGQALGNLSRAFKIQETTQGNGKIFHLSGVKLTEMRWAGVELGHQLGKQLRITTGKRVGRSRTHREKYIQTEDELAYRMHRDDYPHDHVNFTNRRIEHLIHYEMLTSFTDYMLHQGGLRDAMTFDEHGKPQLEETRMRELLKVMGDILGWDELRRVGEWGAFEETYNRNMQAVNDWGESQERRLLMLADSQRVIRHEVMTKVNHISGQLSLLLATDKIENEDLREEIDLVVNKMFTLVRGEMQEFTNAVQAIRDAKPHQYREVLANYDRRLRDVITHYHEIHEILERVLSDLAVYGFEKEAMLIDGLELVKRRLSSVAKNVRDANFKGEPAKVHIEDSIKTVLGYYNGETSLTVDVVYGGQTLDTIDTPEEITVDPDHILGVWDNFIRNAKDASADSIRFIIEEDGDELVIHAEDNGAGIEPEKLASIFDLGFTTKDAHTGIGLHIVKSTIEDASGSISVQSEVGTGTTFTVRFPLKRSEIRSDYGDLGWVYEQVSGFRSRVESSDEDWPALSSEITDFQNGLYRHWKTRDRSKVDAYLETLSQLLADIKRKMNPPVTPPQPAVPASQEPAIKNALGEMAKLTDLYGSKWFFENANYRWGQKGLLMTDPASGWGGGNPQWCECGLASTLIGKMDGINGTIIPMTIKYDHYGETGELSQKTLGHAVILTDDGFVIDSTPWKYFMHGSDSPYVRIEDHPLRAEILRASKTSDAVRTGVHPTNFDNRIIKYGTGSAIPFILEKRDDSHFVEVSLGLATAGARIGRGPERPVLILLYTTMYGRYLPGVKAVGQSAYEVNSTEEWNYYFYPDVILGLKDEIRDLLTRNDPVEMKAFLAQHATQLAERFGKNVGGENHAEEVGRIAAENLPTVMKFLLNLPEISEAELLEKLKTAGQRSEVRSEDIIVQRPPKKEVRLASIEAGKELLSRMLEDGDEGRIYFFDPEDENAPMEVKRSGDVITVDGDNLLETYTDESWVFLVSPLGIISLAQKADILEGWGTIPVENHFKIAIQHILYSDYSFDLDAMHRLAFMQMWPKWQAERTSELSNRNAVQPDMDSYEKSMVSKTIVVPVRDFATEEKTADKEILVNRVVQGEDLVLKFGRSKEAAPLALSDWDRSIGDFWIVIYDKKEPTTPVGYLIHAAPISEMGELLLTGMHSLEKEQGYVGRALTMLLKAGEVEKIYSSNDRSRFAERLYFRLFVNQLDLGIAVRYTDFLNFELQLPRSEVRLLKRWHRRTPDGGAYDHLLPEINQWRGEEIRLEYNHPDTKPVTGELMFPGHTGSGHAVFLKGRRFPSHLQDLKSITHVASNETIELGPIARSEIRTTEQFIPFRVDRGDAVRVTGMDPTNRNVSIRVSSIFEATGRVPTAKTWILASPEVFVMPQSEWESLEQEIRTDDGWNDDLISEKIQDLRRRKKTTGHRTSHRFDLVGTDRFIIFNTETKEHFWIRVLKVNTGSTSSSKSIEYLVPAELPAGANIEGKLYPLPDRRSEVRLSFEDAQQGALSALKEGRITPVAERKQVDRVNRILQELEDTFDIVRKETKLKTKGRRKARHRQGKQAESEEPKVKVQIITTFKKTPKAQYKGSEAHKKATGAKWQEIIPHLKGLLGKQTILASSSEDYASLSLADGVALIAEGLFQRDGEAADLALRLLFAKEGYILHQNHKSAGAMTPFEKEVNGLMIAFGIYATLEDGERMKMSAAFQVSDRHSRPKELDFLKLFWDLHFGITDGKGSHRDVRSKIQEFVRSQYMAIESATTEVMPNDLKVMEMEPSDRMGVFQESFLKASVANPPQVTESEGVWSWSRAVPTLNKSVQIEIQSMKQVRERTRVLSIEYQLDGAEGSNTIEIEAEADKTYGHKYYYKVDGVEIVHHLQDGRTLQDDLIRVLRPIATTLETIRSDRVELGDEDGLNQVLSEWIKFFKQSFHLSSSREERHHVSGDFYTESSWNTEQDRVAAATALLNERRAKRQLDPDARITVLGIDYEHEANPHVTRLMETLKQIGFADVEYGHTGRGADILIYVVDHGDEHYESDQPDYTKQGDPDSRVFEWRVRQGILSEVVEPAEWTESRSSWSFSGSRYKSKSRKSESFRSRAITAPIAAEYISRQTVPQYAEQSEALHPDAKGLVSFERDIDDELEELENSFRLTLYGFQETGKEPGLTEEFGSTQIQAESAFSDEKTYKVRTTVTNEEDDLDRKADIVMLRWRGDLECTGVCERVRTQFPRTVIVLFNPETKKLGRVEPGGVVREWAHDVADDIDVADFVSAEMVAAGKVQRESQNAWREKMFRLLRTSEIFVHVSDEFERAAVERSRISFRSKPRYEFPPDGKKGAPRLIFENFEVLGQVRLKEEDEVEIVFDKDDRRYWKATVIENDDGKLVLTAPQGMKLSEYLKENADSGSIRKVYKQVTADVQLRFLREVLEEPEKYPLVAQALGFQANTRTPPHERLSWLALKNEKIRDNEKQLELLERALNGDSIELGWGPPGTGKTTVAAEVLYQNHMLGKAQLVSAQTNRAVDNLLLAAKEKGIKVYRVGNNPNIFDPDLRDDWIYAKRPRYPKKPRDQNDKQAMSDYRDAMQAYRHEYQRWKEEIMYEISSGRAIVGGTIIGLAIDKLLNKEMMEGGEHVWRNDGTYFVKGGTPFQFDRGVVEEASVASIAELLVVFSKIKEKALVIGDTRQLGLSEIKGDLEERLISSTLDGHDIEMMETSLFKFLYEQGKYNVTMLEDVFRMTPLQVKLTTRNYGEKLRAMRDVPDDVNRNSLVVIDTKGLGFVAPDADRVGTSLFNPVEADIVMHILQGLGQHADVDPDWLGLVTPYAAQIGEYKRRIKSLVLDNNPRGRQAYDKVAAVLGNVGTAYPFQGREKPIMVVSPVWRAQPKEHGFISTGFMGIEMWNVITSRNQEALVVVINSDTFLNSKNREVAAFIDHMLTLARDEGVYIELSDAMKLPDLSEQFAVWKDWVPQVHLRKGQKKLGDEFDRGTILLPGRDFQSGSGGGQRRDHRGRRPKRSEVRKDKILDTPFAELSSLTWDLQGLLVAHAVKHPDENTLRKLMRNRNAVQMTGAFPGGPGGIYGFGPARLKVLGEYLARNNKPRIRGLALDLKFRSKDPAEWQVMDLASYVSREVGKIDYKVINRLSKMNIWTLGELVERFHELESPNFSAEDLRDIKLGLVALGLYKSKTKQLKAMSRIQRVFGQLFKYFWEPETFEDDGSSFEWGVKAKHRDSHIKIKEDSKGWSIEMQGSDIPALPPRDYHADIIIISFDRSTNQLSIKEQTRKGKAKKLSTRKITRVQVSRDPLLRFVYDDFDEHNRSSFDLALEKPAIDALVQAVPNRLKLNDDKGLLWESRDFDLYIVPSNIAKDYDSRSEVRTAVGNHFEYEGDVATKSYQRFEKFVSRVEGDSLMQPVLDRVTGFMRGSKRIKFRWDDNIVRSRYDYDDKKDIQTRLISHAHTSPSLNTELEVNGWSGIALSVSPSVGTIEHQFSMFVHELLKLDITIDMIRAFTLKFGEVNEMNDMGYTEWMAYARQWRLREHFGWDKRGEAFNMDLAFRIYRYWHRTEKAIYFYALDGESIGISDVALQQLIDAAKKVEDWKDEDDLRAAISKMQDDKDNAGSGIMTGDDLATDVSVRMARGFNTYEYRHKGDTVFHLGSLPADVRSELIDMGSKLQADSDTFARSELRDNFWAGQTKVYWTSENNDRFRLLTEAAVEHLKRWYSLQVRDRQITFKETELYLQDYDQLPPKMHQVKVEYYHNYEIAMLSGLPLDDESLRFFIDTTQLFRDIIEQRKHDDFLIEKLTRVPPRMAVLVTKWLANTAELDDFSKEQARAREFLKRFVDQLYSQFGLREALEAYSQMITEHIRGVMRDEDIAEENILVVPLHVAATELGDYVVSHLRDEGLRIDERSMLLTRAMRDVVQSKGININAFVQEELGLDGSEKHVVFIDDGGFGSFNKLLEPALARLGISSEYFLLYHKNSDRNQLARGLNEETDWLTESSRLLWFAYMIGDGFDHATLSAGYDLSDSGGAFGVTRPNTPRPWFYHFLRDSFDQWIESTRTSELVAAGDKRSEIRLAQSELRPSVTAVDPSVVLNVQKDIVISVEQQTIDSMRADLWKKFINEMLGYLAANQGKVRVHIPDLNHLVHSDRIEEIRDTSMLMDDEELFDAISQDEELQVFHFASGGDIEHARTRISAGLGEEIREYFAIYPGALGTALLYAHYPEQMDQHLSQLPIGYRYDPESNYTAAVLGELFSAYSVASISA